MVKQFEGDENFGTPYMWLIFPPSDALHIYCGADRGSGLQAKGHLEQWRIA